MTNSWKEWQGRTVDGKFVLGTYLGGSEGSAVFRTRISASSDSTSASGPAGGSPGKGAESESGVSESKTDAAIKLVVADGAESESPLQRWKVAMALNHPNLLRILTVGRCIVDGRELVYAVEEFSEENLGQVVPTRALDADETRSTLLPVLAALEYVHKQGLVHGAIRPSNFLGVENQVKLSSDSLRPAGEVPRSISLYDAPEVLTAGISPASDVWSFGMTMVEMLSQHVPVWDPARMSPPEIEGEIESNVPEPFRGIAQRCLTLDPAQRCGVREIADRLRDEPGGQPERNTKFTVADAGKPTRVAAIAASHEKTAKWPYMLLLVAAIAVAIFLIVRPRPSSGPSGVQSSAPNTQTSSAPPPSSPQTPSPQASSPPASPTQAGQPAPGEQQLGQSSPSAAQKSAASNPSDTEEIVERATPQVAPSARRTISGKIKVRVRVTVNPAGDVTEAKLKEGGSSKYFARVAVEAARRWKFAPAPDANRRDWILLFAFTRARTEMSATRAR
ncbi:MAG: TonB family protein [Terriglobales bacterium]